VRISTERYLGYTLALDQEKNLFQVKIFNNAGSLAASSMSHTEAGSALAEVRRFVDALRNARRRWSADPV
jgi:hypothetical protein